MHEAITELECPVCGTNSKPSALTFRDRVPILQNRVFSSAEEARDFTTGVVHAVQCTACSFVWNAKFDPDALIYDQHYDNDVSASSYYQSHLEEMAKRLIAMVPNNQPIYYVEVGCGEADFMRLVKEQAGERFVSGLGFDPSYSATTGELPPDIQIIRSYFDQGQIDKLPKETNLIASRHTIEHIAKPRPFAQVLAKAATELDAVLAVETPDVDWIFENNAFQDFFFEHCSLFNPSSIDHLFSQFGLSCETMPVYGGQYMWSKLTAGQVGKAKVSGVNSIALGKRYLEREKDTIGQCLNYLMKRREIGPIAIWGAASKGVTFSLMVDSHNPGLISHAIDLNPKKQNAYLPITAKRVSTPEEAMADHVATIIVMNPNYRDEIVDQISDMGWNAEVTVLQ